ncbi:MAG: AsmA-like C-terminal region-containing protein [Chitinophagales bacterium]
MIKKISLIILGIVLLFVAALIIAPNFFKAKIVTFAKEQLNANLNAHVDFSDISLSLIKDFPDLHVCLENLEIAGKGDFEGDTLANISQLALTVNVKSLFNQEQIEVKQVKVIDAKILAKVLRDGRANWDVTLPDTIEVTNAEAEPTTFNVGVQAYSLANTDIIYDDASLDTKVTIKGLNHEGKGDFTQDLFTLNTKTTMDAFTINYEGIAYLNRVKTKVDTDFAMDMVNGKYTFKGGKVLLNALPIDVDGWLQMPPTSDDINMDITFDAKESDFKYLLSLMPAIYMNDFKGVETKGRMALKGFVKGTYNAQKMPGFNVDLKAMDAYFQYPDLPKAVENIQVDMQIKNPDGVPDHTEINFSKFAFQVDQDPFEIVANIKTPVSDPNFDMKAKGKVNLTNLAQSYPMEGAKMSGMIEADIVAKGKMSDVEQSRYEQFDMSGDLKVNDLIYASTNLPQDLNVKSLSMFFTPSNVQVRDINAIVGRSDFKGSASVENILGYAFGKGTLTGKADIQSNQFDCNEWLLEEGETLPADPDAKGASEVYEVFEVPENIDMTITAKAGKVLYDNIELKNVTGKLLVKDESIELADFSSETLDGSIVMNGSYSTKDHSNKPHVSMEYDMKEIDVVQAFITFNSMEKLAPIAKYIKGNFSSKFKVSGNLNENMMPDMSTFDGNGLFAVLKGSIAGFKPMDKIANALQIKELEQVKNFDASTIFSFENGRVSVKPFDISPFGVKMNIFGTHGFDQTLDYDIKVQVPRDKLGAQAKSLVLSLTEQLAKKDIVLDVPDFININLKLTGTLQDPKVETDFTDALASAGKSVVDAAKELIDESVNMVKDEAKELVDKQKEKITQATNEVKDELKDKAGGLTKDLKSKALENPDSAKVFLKDQVKDLKENGTKGVADKATDLLKGGKDDTKGSKDSLEQNLGKNAKDKANETLKNLFGKPKKKEEPVDTSGN